MESLVRRLPIKQFSNIFTSNIIRNKSNSLPCKKNPNYLILRATASDYPCILDLMRTTYYSDEPTSSSLAFRSNAVFENSTMGILSEGYTLVAKCKYNGDILGACINETTNPWDPDLKDKLACKVACVKTRQLLHFYAHIQRAPRLWHKYDVPKVFEMAYLFIRRDERKKGIALKLMQESRLLAADCGFHLVRVDATSYFTAKLCEKMDLKMIYEIPYCSYVGADTKPIFRPPEPHTSVKVFIDDDPQTSTMENKDKNKKRKK